MNTSVKTDRRELIYCIFAVIYAYISMFVLSGSYKLICVLFCLGGAAVLLLRRKRLRENLSLQSVFAAAYFLIVALSLIWAAAGKLYLNEFNKLLIGLFFYVAVLAFSERSEAAVRRAAVAAASVCSFYALLSVDLATLRLTEPVMSLIPAFDADMTAFESGTRLTGMFANANILAGVLSLGIFLSLYLLESAESRGRRVFASVCAAMCSYTFVMAFSMGAAGFFVLAAILYFIAAGERRISVFVRMVYIAVFALAAVFVSFRFYEASDPASFVPLLSILLCAAACAAAELYLFPPVRSALEKKRVLFRVILLAAALLAAVYAAVALTLSGGQYFAPGSVLRRSAYLEAGDYTLSCSCEGQLNVKVESQNASETMMHTSTVLYEGNVSGCAFTVPDGSLVVYFSFYTGSEAYLDGAVLSDGTRLKLDYKLLPSFIANRLQGLRANENAIQRTIFFADGMKLFRRSPVLGSGLGSFESLSYGYQDFHYMTKYVHNHYIQVLLDNGVVGFAAYIALLLSSLVLLVKNRRKDSPFRLFYPAAVACFTMLCLHSAMEVVMSASVYIPLAGALLALISLCWGKPAAAEASRWSLFSVFAAFAVLISLNMIAGASVRSSIGRTTDFYSALDSAVSIDVFDKADYKLSYVLNSTGAGSRYRARALKYADELADRPSNSAHAYLVGFHLADGDYQRAVYAAKNGVSFNRANPEIWNGIIALFDGYVEDKEAAAGVAELYAMMLECNKELMNPIVLGPEAEAVVTRAAEVLAET
ncbi:MAG: O-antigen ligase family protein [Oscillospiraceae bacterium]|nr:O-antigen ligase family protein [Oscillospiraceae bacterium]